MKPGALCVDCLGLALVDCGRDKPNSESWGAMRIFVFFLSDKQPTILPTSRRPNFTKFEHNTSIGVVMNPFGTDFENCLVKGCFFAKKCKKKKFFQRLATSGRHNSAMTVDRQNSLPRSRYRKSSFHFYRRNQFKVIP